MRLVLIKIHSYIQYLPNKSTYKWLNALPRPNVENFVFFQGNNLNNQSNQYGGVHPWIAHPKRAFFRFGGVPTPPHTPPRSIPGYQIKKTTLGCWQISCRWCVFGSCFKWIICVSSNLCFIKLSNKKKTLEFWQISYRWCLMRSSFIWI